MAISGSRVGNVVSAISDSTDRIVANVSTGGGGPIGVAYDAASGKIFNSTTPMEKER